MPLLQAKQVDTTELEIEILKQLQDWDLKQVICKAQGWDAKWTKKRWNNINQH